MLKLVIEAGIGFMTGLSGITVPGPVFIFILQQSIARGFKSGVLATSAHALVGVLVIVLIVLTGVAELFQSPAFELYMGLVGGLSLLILGMIIVKNPSKQVPRVNSNADGLSVGPFVGGLIVSVSNPAFFLWWAVIGLPMLGQARDFAGIAGIYAWTLGIVAAIFLWYGGIAFISAQGKARIPCNVFFAISVVCGLFLMFMGLVFILKYYVNLI